MLQFADEAPEHSRRYIPRFQRIDETAGPGQWHPPEHGPPPSREVGRDLPAIRLAALPSDQTELFQPVHPALHRRDRSPEAAGELDHGQSGIPLEESQDQDQRRGETVPPEIPPVGLAPLPDSIHARDDMVYFLFHTV